MKAHIGRMQLLQACAAAPGRLVLDSQLFFGCTGLIPEVGRWRLDPDDAGATDSAL